MKNINSNTCKWMSVNGGDLEPFSPNIPTTYTNIKYYLTTYLTSLDEEFKDNDYVKNVDLSKMNVSELVSMNNTFENCHFLENVTLNDNMSEDIELNDTFKGTDLSYINIISYSNALKDKFDKVIEDSKPITFDILKERLLDTNVSYTIKLNQNIDTNENLVVKGIKTVDLNGYTLRNINTTKTKNVFMFNVTGDTAYLTLKDSVGTGKVDAGDKQNAAQVCVLANKGGTVDIYGGHYITGADKTGVDRNDTIYTIDGFLNIYGGTFQSTYEWLRKLPDGSYIGEHFCINNKDNDNSVIKIYGGNFIDMNPSYNWTDPTPVTHWVQTGYTVLKNVLDTYTLYSVIPENS